MNIANKISLFRILTVPFFIGMVLYYDAQRDYLRYVALGIFILASLSDAVDGYIARTRKQKTRAGTILDPLADKLLLSAAFVCLYVKDGMTGGMRMPLWVVLVILSRDILIIAGSCLIFMLRHGFEFVPTAWGKFATAFQMLTIICVLVQWAYTPVVWTIASSLTIISGIQYLRGGFKILYVEHSSGNTH
jgi:CDP-diacylglycerol--glycerol-3-phosphate 3-phosphatidyltransferase